MTGARKTGLDETGRLLGHVLRAALSEALERRLALRRAMGKGAFRKPGKRQGASETGAPGVTGEGRHGRKGE